MSDTRILKTKWFQRFARRERISDATLREAIARWLLGNEPFTARLNPDLPGYSDYDQLMRLDEWQGRERANAGDVA